MNEGPANGPSPWEQAALLLAASPQLLIVDHVRRDADSFGSAVALALGLRSRGLDARVYCGAEPPLAPVMAALDTTGTLADPAALFAREPGGRVRVAVDTARPDRLQLAGAVALNIDHHHRDNPRYGGLNLVEREAATAVLVARLLAVMEIPLTRPMATALYAATWADTVGFSTASTTPAALTLAAECVAQGLDAARVTGPLEVKEGRYLRYLAAVLGAMELEPKAGWVLATVHRETYRAFGLTAWQAARAIEALAHVAEAELAVLILEEGPGQTRLRFRGRGRPVRELARQFGGGGHRYAAGAQTHETPDQVRRQLKTLLKGR